MAAPAEDIAPVEEVLAAQDDATVSALPAETTLDTDEMAADQATAVPEITANAVAEATEAVEPEAPQPPLERGLATILGGPATSGRPTWLDVPPERVGPLLALFADEGARLLAMTVLLPADTAVAAPPAAIALRYHFVVNEIPITMSTQTLPRSAPSAVGLFPAMTWRERELAGEYGLRFIEPLMEGADQGSGVGGQESGFDDRAPDALILRSRPLTPDP